MELSPCKEIRVWIHGTCRSSIYHHRHNRFCAHIFPTKKDEVYDSLFEGYLSKTEGDVSDYMNKLGVAKIPSGHIILGNYSGAGTRRDKVQDASMGKNMEQDADEIAKDIYQSLIALDRQDPLPPVHIQGFSRGGFTALLVAEKLNRWIKDAGSTQIQVATKLSESTVAFSKKAQALKQKSLTIRVFSSDPTPGFTKGRPKGIIDFDSSETKVENEVFTYYNTNHNVWGFEGESSNQIRSAILALNKDQHVLTGAFGHNSLQSIYKNDMREVKIFDDVIKKKHQNIPRYVNAKTLGATVSLGLVAQQIRSNQHYTSEEAEGFLQAMRTSMNKRLHEHITNQHQDIRYEDFLCAGWDKKYLKKETYYKKNERQKDTPPMVGIADAEDLMKINEVLKDSLYHPDAKGLFRHHTSTKRQRKILGDGYGAILEHVRAQSRLYIGQTIAPPTAYELDRVLHDFNVELHQTKIHRETEDRQKQVFDIIHALKEKIKKRRDRLWTRVLDKKDQRDKLHKINQQKADNEKKIQLALRKGSAEAKQYIADNIRLDKQYYERMLTFKLEREIRAYDLLYARLCYLITEEDVFSDENVARLKDLSKQVNSCLVTQRLSMKHTVQIGRKHHQKN